MPFFPVDDRFHSHPKAAAVSLAAIGLWTLAGSWANDHLTDGDVPRHMVESLSRGATELADELVSCGLWRRTKAGYRFHQWHEDGDGSHRNITRSEATAAKQKTSSGGQLGNHRRWHVKRGVVDPECRFCQEERSSPPRSGGRSGGRIGGESGANPSTPPHSRSGTSTYTGSGGQRAREAPPDTRQPQSQTERLLAEHVAKRHRPPPSKQRARIAEEIHALLTDDPPFTPDEVHTVLDAWAARSLGPGSIGSIADELFCRDNRTVQALDRHRALPASRASPQSGGTDANLSGWANLAAELQADEGSAP